MVPADAAGALAREREAAHLVDHATRSRPLESDAADRGEDVDPPRRTADLQVLVRAGEILDTGAPNRMRAFQTRPALARSLAIQTLRSPSRGARCGPPWHGRLRAGIGGPSTSGEGKRLHGERPHHRQALFGSGPGAEVVRRPSPAGRGGRARSPDWLAEPHAPCAIIGRRRSGFRGSSPAGAHSPSSAPSSPRLSSARGWGASSSRPPANVQRCSGR